MSDADVDGSHIRTLLLTFFFRYMRPLIANGNLYIAQPPLYRVRVGKNDRYVYSDNERDTYIASLPANERNRCQRTQPRGNPALQRPRRNECRTAVGYYHESRQSRDSAGDHGRCSGRRRNVHDVDGRLGAPTQTLHPDIRVDADMKYANWV
ncbi:MAG: hypothetical protein RL076_1599 [Chloroflexota bacterium]